MEEKRFLNMEWRKRKDGKDGIVYKPFVCTTPEECLSCYVIRLHDGNPSYCGNPKTLLRAIAMTEGRTMEAIEVANGKPFVEGDRIFIPKGCTLLCGDCGKNTVSKRARRPSVKTGLRCPKCHSRNVLNADGSQIEGLKKRRSHKLTMNRPETESEKPSTIGDGVEPTIVKTKRKPISKKRASAVDKLRQKMRKGVAPVPEGTPAPLEEPTPTEEGIEGFLGEDDLAEIFDPETFEILHELEVEALCRKFNKPRYKSYQKVIRSMSKKTALIMKLVFRHPDISLGLKIVIGLYILQQLTLIGAIMMGSEVGFKPQTDEEIEEMKNPKESEEEEV